MKTYLLSIACLLSSATISFAQEHDHENDAPPPPAHDYEYAFVGSEVRIGHGLLPAEQLFAGGGRRFDYKNRNYSGSIFATYKYHMNDVVSLGLTLAYEYESGTFSGNQFYNVYVGPSYAPVYLGVGNFTRSSYTIAPELTVTYGNFGDGLVSMYCTAGAGYTIRNEKISYANTVTEYGMYRPIHFTGYISPLGLRFGRQLSGFFEFGLGYKGVFNYGLSYRF